MPPKNKLGRKKKGFVVGKQRPSMRGMVTTPLGQSRINTATATPVITRSVALDGHARAYLRLLSDPCNAPMVPAPFDGSGTGMYIRTKTLLTPTTVAGSTDILLQFAPQYLNENYFGNIPTAAGIARGPLMWASTATGTTATLVSASQIAPNLFGGTTQAPLLTTAGTFSQARCLAACVKVMYTGSELNRQGYVFASNAPVRTFSTCTNASTANPSTTMGMFPQGDRLGERVHEYRWLPTHDDQGFVELTGVRGALGVSIGNILGGSTLSVGVLGAASGSITFEITCVWEVTVGGTLATGAGSGLAETSTPSPSRNTLNDVLRFIGDTGKWALRPENASRIVSTGKMLATMLV